MVFYLRNATGKVFSIWSTRPVTLDCLTDNDDRSTVRLVSVFHRLQGSNNLIVISCIVDSNHVPSVRRPLVLDVVGVFLHNATDEFVIDTSIVVGHQHT